MLNRFELPSPDPSTYLGSDSVGNFAENPHDILQNARLSRDEARFKEVYDNSWKVFCATVDKGIQSGLIDPLGKGNSVYPIFERLFDEMRKSSYGKRIVNTYWVADNANKAFGAESKLVKLVERTYPNIFNGVLIYRAFSEPKHYSLSSAFHRQIDTISEEIGLKTSDELHGYIASLEMLNTARRIIYESLSTHISQFEEVNKGQMIIKVPDWEEKLGGILRKVEPYCYFSEVLQGRITEKEKELFGDEAEVASAVWKAVLFMLRPQEKPSYNVVKLRDPIMRNLIQKKYQDARFLVEDLMARRPEMFYSFVRETLQIEPDVLAELYAEDVKNLKEVKQKEEDDRTRHIAELTDSMVSLLGKTLVSPDGIIKIKIRTRGKQNSSKRNRFFFTEVDGTTGMREFLGTKYARGFSTENLKALIEMFGLKVQE